MRKLLIGLENVPQMRAPARLIQRASHSPVMEYFPIQGLNISDR